MQSRVLRSSVCQGAPLPTSSYLIDRFAARYYLQRVIGFFLGALVWASFHLWDIQLFRGRSTFEEIRTIRLGIGLPLILICGFLSTVPKFRTDRWISLLGSTAIAVAWVCLVYMLAINDPITTFDLYIPGLLTILLYHFTMFRHRWVIATAVGIVLIALFNLAGQVVLREAMSRHLSVGWFSANAYMITILVVGAVLCYQIETSFFQFEKQRLELESKNAALAESREQSHFAMKKAKQAHQDRTNFLLKASHDLRQPMTAIKFYVKQLRDSTQAPKQAETVEKLQRAVSSMNELYTALHDFNKLDANGLSPKKTMVFLPAIIEEEFDNCVPIAIDKGLKLRVRQPCLAWVETDPSFVQRMVRNLLINALSYTDKGGVLLAVRRRGSDVYIQVFDTGPGIEESALQSVFLPFVRMRPDDTLTERGLGLGLAIASGMAESLGTRIDVISRRDRGSMFAFRLPISAPPEAIETAESTTRVADSVTSAQGCCIAIVDDDLDILDATGSLLQAAGYQVVTGRNLNELLRALTPLSGVPSLMLADIELGPTENAWDIHAALQQTIGQTIPAVLMTGTVTVAYRDRARQHLQVVLQKPCEPEELLSAVHTALTEPHVGPRVTARQS